MRLNKKTQYAILLTLYLSRSGRTTLDSAAQGLNVPKAFLSQVAAEMRRKGLLISAKGPNGGYSLARDLEMIEVMEAFNPALFLYTKEYNQLGLGGSERRSFGYLVVDMILGLTPVLTKRASQVLQTLVERENIILDSISETGAH